MTTKMKAHERPSDDDRAQTGTWRQHGRSYVSKSLCTKMAKELARSYASYQTNLSSIDHIVKYTCKHIGNYATSYSGIDDFIKGASLSINPLPSYTTLTFYTSDIDALHSDWMITRSDLEAVWEASAVVIEQLEQLAKEEASGSKNVGQRTSGRPWASKPSRTREASE